MPASRTLAFRGRSRERQALDRLLDRVRGGESAALVIRGEAGIGKTALMSYCARQAAGCRLVQIDGVESEMELPLAALHQLCMPMLSSLDALPEPQQRALRVAFGLASEPAPDRFVLGLAVLSLLAENAAERPLICLGGFVQRRTGEAGHGGRGCRRGGGHRGSGSGRPCAGRGRRRRRGGSLLR